MMLVAPFRGPAMIHTEESARITLVDGLTEVSTPADFWSLDPGGDAPGWVEASPGGIAPAPRASHDAAALHGSVYRFGGFGNNGALADFWRLAGVGGAS